MTKFNIPKLKFDWFLTGMGRLAQNLVASFYGEERNPHNTTLQAPVSELF